MKMKKIYKILLLIAVCIIAVSGCKKEDKVSGTRIYYTDSEGVSLVEKGTRIKGKTKKAQINYVLGKVQKNTDNINYRSAFVKGVKIKNWSLHSKNLTVDFNRAYQKLSVTEEIVLRASVVQSLGQIDGVDTVLFESAVLPEGTKVLSVSVKDHICYVNLDAGFLDTTNVMNPEVPVYAIVNSIVDGSAISRVQILIDGKTDITYMGKINLEKPLSRNPNIVEGE